MIPFCILAIEDESDRAFMESLFLQYNRLMYHEIFKITKNLDDTEDILQSSLVKLIEKIPLILTNFPLNFCQATFTPETIENLSNSYFLAKELGFAEWYWAPDIYNSNWEEKHFQIIKE